MEDIMKRLTLFIVLALFIQSGVSSQPCLQNGITFTTQADIDNFQTNNPNCTEIEGDVIISGNDITNLTGLNVLTSIRGNLAIGYNDVLMSLTGLDNVTSIGGNLAIAHNSALINLTGLDNVTSIGGNLTIEYNWSSLTSLTGLDNVTSVGGDLFIRVNIALTSLTGLDNLTSIGGNLHIWHNDPLTSLTGLDNINANSIDSLEIWDNTSLSTCDVQSVCDYLVKPSGTIEIFNNAVGCNSQQEVEEACGITSVENLSENGSFAIYPNPFRTQATIIIENLSPGEAIKFYLFDFLGREVSRTVITSSPFILNRYGLTNGMYIWKAAGGEWIASGKLIFQ